MSSAATTTARTLTSFEVDGARPSVTGRIAHPVVINGEDVARMVRSGSRFYAIGLHGHTISLSAGYEATCDAITAAWHAGVI